MGKHCDKCGASLNTHKHSLSKSLVIGLIRLYKAGRCCNLKELGLTRNQWDNFQKLKYWGVVEQVSVDGKQKTGVWNVTELGLLFLSGKTSVPKSVRTFRGAVITDTTLTKTVTIHGFKDLDSFYKQREEYASDMQPAMEERA